jgi:phosphatidylserine/phosphatidylglycerophosphate/cardiolipin synthase-like enzyme
VRRITSNVLAAVLICASACSETEPASSMAMPLAEPGARAPRESGGPPGARDVDPPRSAKVWSHFNWPAAHGGSDPTITNELIRMIDATPPGATIRGHFFALASERVAASLNAAFDRGVTMRITLDGNASIRASAPARSVAAHMGTSAGYCGGTDSTTGSVGCITNAVGGISHIKFLTFSETKAPDGVLYPNVVWFSSYNAGDSSGDADSNNATSIYDSELSYAEMTAHQVRMQNQVHFANNAYYDRAAGRGYFHDPNARFEAHLSPSRTNLVLAQLDRVSADDTCVVRVFQALISDSMLPSIEKLVSLQSQGCRVFVLAGSVQEKALAALKAAGTEVRFVRDVHDKIFFIDAKLDGSATNRRVVFTGSHNWSTKSSYGNDELLAGLEGDDVYQEFIEHFLRGWRSASAR